MNQFHSSKELPPNKDMRYKIRFVTTHEGQGGGLRGSDREEEKEKEREREKRKGKRKRKRNVVGMG